MTKTGWSNSANYRKAIKKITTKKRDKISQCSYGNHVYVNSLGNDVVLSPSGQFKIDNLDSCLSLNESDFIVF